VAERSIPSHKPEDTSLPRDAHIASRIAALAGPREVLVSATTRDLVAGSGLSFDDRGEFELKGVGELRRVYRVLLGGYV
jgi:class 3 adenylate cyclase